MLPDLAVSCQKSQAAGFGNLPELIIILGHRMKGLIKTHFLPYFGKNKKHTVFYLDNTKHYAMLL